MFKKKPVIKPLAPLRSSDRRKLADQIIQDYRLDTDSSKTPEAEQTPEQKAEATAARTSLRNALLPDNLQSARFTTTRGEDLKQVSGTIYVGNQDGEEQRVLWFQVDGRMYPTVYTLWRNPNIVPLLHTPDVVVKKLQGGADLMTPGLAGGPPFPQKAKKRAVVAIAGTDKPTVPVVVGICEIDVSALEKVQGARGHAVENMHWAGDEIWGYSTSSKPGQQLPEELEGWAKVLEARGLTEKVEDLTMDDPDDGGGVPLENGDKQAPNAHTESVTTETENGADLPSQPEAKALTQKEVDDAFRNAFLYGIHHYKTNNANSPNFGLVFPLSQSFVMSTLVQPFLPAFTPEQSQQLQIKKTTWKNIKKFVKSLDKEKIIKSKDKDGNETVILDVDFRDEAVLNFKPYRLPKKETTAGGSLGRGEIATDKIDTGDDAVGQKLQVVSFYKPSAKLQPIFDAGSKALYTPAEVRELVTSYIESEKLVSETNKRLVKLNPTLANSVFDGSGSLDTEVQAKGAVPRDALIERILHGMSNSYAIVRNGADPSSVKAKSGPVPKVHITLETRSGNKTVTKVSGLEAYYINTRPLADELRKVCAGSTSVEPLAGGAKKHEKEVMEVMVQGPQKDAVVKALERRGLDKRWVEVLDKTKGKKK
ncbi:related to filamentous baseplate Ligatin, contains PUA domain [Lecanosticta acicola]|uniref:Related to filamentous baseplate Ligatin, contains PUA domain n=1 Tax=Lecanosticta acicola TaxID=111012 RepID=A0AAI8Z253_9PEZI|nr:related to filamentous baseplate Ligatin, contains PUA domain [Lecanosticta acicola]